MTTTTQPPIDEMVEYRAKCEAEGWPLPPPTRLWHIPNWLLTAMKGAGYRLGYGDQHAPMYAGGWLDHWGSCDHGTVFVSEVYGLSDRAMKELVAFADRCGLDARVPEGLAWWYPSRCVRIEVRPRKETPR